MRAVARSFLLAALLLTGLAATPAQAGYTLQRAAEVTLPGPTGRFDYMALDPTHDRLFINQMGAGRVLVFDLHSRKLVGQVAGLQSPTGMTLAPQRRLAFVSDPGGTMDEVWGNGTVDAIDTASLRIVRRFAADGFPDGSAWVLDVGRLFVSNERGGRETVIGGTPLRVEARIPLGGEAGNSVFDAASDRVLVNVQTRNQIIALDPRTLAITTRVDVPSACEHNHGLLVDDADHLAFVACDGNARLLSLRLPELSLVDLHHLGRDPDVLALDAARHRLWVASESGVVSVFAVMPAGLQTLWRGFVGPDAHSLAIDLATGWAWFALQDVDGTPVLRAMKLVWRQGAEAQESSARSAARRCTLNAKIGPILAGRTRAEPMGTGPCSQLRYF